MEAMFITHTYTMYILIYLKIFVHCLQRKVVVRIHIHWQGKRFYISKL